ncbi:YaiI/YqxD family protein [Thalassobaculum sp.]|uniref:YaiI/YqxD family protein n=1 Tax=Thalassobaculum sp. TaxID=2022740 RepID=UPI0032EDDF40
MTQADRPPEIYVDADACPVRDEILKVADRHGLIVHLVSNRGFRTTDRPNVHNVLVPDTFDAADDWIAERIGPGDVAITGDIPLAARCLENGAKVLDTKGKAFTEHGIGMALAMRELMSDLRAMGEVSGGGPGFTKQDRSRFLGALEQAVRR